MYLKNKSGILVIFLYLSFILTWSKIQRLGCANDVAKILKLEGDSITGLIFIDLRNNGGGSMLEAMNLGIFVDEGPLFIYKEKNKNHR